MKTNQWSWWLAWAIMCVACTTGKKVVVTDDGKIDVSIIHVNDVYEIEPLGRGESGGIARLATLIRLEKQRNPNTIAVLSGDFLSPSAFIDVREKDQRIVGLQMVAALNAAGIDYVTFGNHEFDNKRQLLQMAIDSSRFTWLAGNVRQQWPDSVGLWYKLGQPLPAQTIHLFKDRDGTTAHVGLFGLCLDEYKRDFVHYLPPLSTAVKAAKELSAQSDVVVGLTHQNERDDVALSKQLTHSKCKLIMGGHVHTHHHERIGGITYARADANARTAYIHRLTIYPTLGKSVVQSELIPLNNLVASDSTTAAVIQNWMSKAANHFSQLGIDINEEIYTLTEPWDALEKTVRYRQCEVGQVVCRALQAPYPEADAVIYQSGMLRLDDVIDGNLRAWDAIRLLPFGGTAHLVAMRGYVLRRCLDISETIPGDGGYLQYGGIARDTSGGWLVNNQPLNDSLTYKVVSTDYLLEGREKEYSFLKNHPDIQPYPSESSATDIRLAFINYLKTKK